MGEYTNSDSTIDTLPQNVGLARYIHHMPKLLETQVVRLSPTPCLEN